MEHDNILGNNNLLGEYVSNTVKTLIDEHPKAAKVISYGFLSLIFGGACVYEILH